MTKEQVCEICNGGTNEIFMLRAFGECDFYDFCVCEKCYDYYSSDIFTAEDILNIIKEREGK